MLEAILCALVFVACCIRFNKRAAASAKTPLADIKAQTTATVHEELLAVSSSSSPTHSLTSSTPLKRRHSLEDVLEAEESLTKKSDKYKRRRSLGRKLWSHLGKFCSNLILLVFFQTSLWQPTGTASITSTERPTGI